MVHPGRVRLRTGDVRTSSFLTLKVGMTCNCNPPWSSVILTWPLARGLKLAYYTSKFSLHAVYKLGHRHFLCANVCVPNNSLVELMQYYEQTVFVPLFYGFIHDSE